MATTVKVSYRRFVDCVYLLLAILPGPLKGLCDGFILHGRIPKHLKYLGKGLWRNEILWEYYQEGRMQLIRRKPSEQNLNAAKVCAFIYKAAMHLRSN